MTWGRGQLGGKLLKGLLRGMIMKKKKCWETLCYREARRAKPEPVKMYPLLASPSWQLLSAPPKAGSGKHKGSLCKTFFFKLEKISVNVFPSYMGAEGEGEGEGMEKAQNRPQAWAS